MLPRRSRAHPRTSSWRTNVSEPQTTTATPGAHMAAELASQPETWARAADLRDEQALLPASGARIAVVGCGTSWFIAQSYAWLREAGGHGETDAFAASEAFVDRGYDAVVALTRSGTTTEVLELVERLRGRGAHRRRHRRRDLAARRPRRRRGDPAVRRRAVGRADPVRHHRPRPLPRLARRGPRRRRSPMPSAPSPRTLDPALVDAEQFTFLGRGWTVGLAHEAALKMREAVAVVDRVVPVDGVPPRPDLDRRARPGHLALRRGARRPRRRGRRDRCALRGRHARPDGRARPGPARRPRARPRPRPRPRRAAQPHPLGHPRGADARPGSGSTAPAPSAPARPVLAFDVGGTDTKSALIDGDGRVLGLRRTPTPPTRERTAEAVVAARRGARPRAPRRRTRRAAGRRRA